MIESIQFGSRADALSVIRQAAIQLIEQHATLWELDSLTAEEVFQDCQDNNVVAGYIAGKPVAAMVLTYHDPKFWPDIPPNQAGFIHKLSVVPEYQGKGLAAQMVDFAKDEVTSKGFFWLRLDCHSDRTRLRRFYERLGFNGIREGIVDTHHTIFYQMKLCAGNENL